VRKIFAVCTPDESVAFLAIQARGSCLPSHPAVLTYVARGRGLGSSVTREQRSLENLQIHLLKERN
jgi:hypothetical protein